jgi:hypothetical protein
MAAPRDFSTMFLALSVITFAFGVTFALLALSWLNQLSDSAPIRLFLGVSTIAGVESCPYQLLADPPRLRSKYSLASAVLTRLFATSVAVCSPASEVVCSVLYQSGCLPYRRKLHKNPSFKNNCMIEKKMQQRFNDIVLQYIQGLLHYKSFVK